MSSPRAELSWEPRRAARWLLPAALLALTPKCALCLLAYAGLGAAIGMGGPELCGGPGSTPGAWATSLAWLGVAGLVGAFACRANCRGVRSESPAPGERQ